MKVYVLTDGEYSDYHVVGVFSTREKAEEFRIQLNADGGEDLSGLMELELDSLYGRPPGLIGFSVTMERDGTARVEQDDFVWANGEDTDFSFPWVWSSVNYDTGKVDVWAKDKEHAIKIANEKRIVAIANNLWPDAPIPEVIST